MKTSNFDYLLPPGQIAQEPARPRDHSRLLVLDRKSGKMEHRRFFELGECLHPGDLLVVNQSKVFKARLIGTVGANGVRSGSIGGRMACAPTNIEIFLIRPEGDKWIALAKPGKKLKDGSSVIFSDGEVATAAEKRKDGTALIDFAKPADQVISWANLVGQVPIPPYISQTPKLDSDYQTVYAKTVGSVAAPTAGFHFTEELIEQLKTQGVNLASITLHVGLGTFRPIKTDTIEEHKIHEEWIDVPKETMRAIEETKKNGGRVIAVGTTTVRALESVAIKYKNTDPLLLPLRKGENNPIPLLTKEGLGEVSDRVSTGFSGFTSLFITPGFKFKIVDSMITNFHLPRSSLLVLVSSFASKDLILKAYNEAVRLGYRFYSFGDTMLIK